MTIIQHGREPFSHNKLTLAVSAALVMGPLPLLAAPTDGVVVSGDATIGQAGAVTTITQSTPKAAINWQGFSIGSGETVNFLQPDSSSITLNRVLGNERSVIDGALNANGQIFLINSNGVLFNHGSSVNVGGLVASTLDIKNEDFNAGNYVFQGNGGSGSIINMGTLSAADHGYVALLGKEALNQGVISATLGTAALGAGDKITLNFNGDSLVSVSIDQGALNALVENRQAIHADGGKVFLTARAADELIGSQVNNSGVVEARTLNDLMRDRCPGLRRHREHRRHIGRFGPGQRRRRFHRYQRRQSESCRQRGRHCQLRDRRNRAVADQFPRLYYSQQRRRHVRDLPLQPAG